MGISKGAAIGSFIGFATFGPAGAAIGAVVGTLIDPEPLFGEEKRARMGSIEPNMADEGTPVAYVYGRHNRIGAQILYSSNPWSITTGTSGGGKRGEPTQTTWYADVIYTGAWNRIRRLDRITMNADPVYLQNAQQATGYQVAGPLPWIEVILDAGRTMQRWTYHSGESRWQMVAWQMVIENAKTGGAQGGPVALPHLARYIIGDLVEVENWNANYSQLSTRNRLGIPTFVMRVIDSRVTGVASNGVQNTRLILDLADAGPNDNSWVEINVAQGPQLGTNPFYGPVVLPPPNSSPPAEIGQSAWPWTSWLQNPAGTASNLLINPRNREQFVDDVLDEDLTEITHWTGELQPGPSPLYQSRVGGVNAPALPRVSGFGAAQLKISRFGNVNPQVSLDVDENWEFPGSERSTISMLDTLFTTHGGIPSQFVNLSQYHAKRDMLGMAFSGVQATARLVSPLLVGYDLYLEESDFEIKVRDRLNRSVVPVDHAHLDARPSGAGVRPKLDTTEADAAQLPRRIHVRFIDADRNLDIGNAPDTRDVIDSNTNTVTRQFELLYTMHQNEAIRIARRLMHDAHERSRRVKFRLPVWYSFVTETDMLVLTDATSEEGTKYAGEDHYVLVTSLDIGNDFYVEGEGDWLAEPLAEVTEAPPAEDPPTDPDAPQDAIPEGTDRRIDVGRPADDILRKPATFEATAIDIAALTDEHARQAGFYLAFQQIHSFSAPLGHVWRRLSGGTEWHFMMKATNHATVGRVVGAPLADGVVGVFDYNGYVDIEVYGQEELQGSMADATEAQAMEGQNFCAIGREALSYTSAQLLYSPDEATGSHSGRKFRLSGFLRAQLGTEIEVDRHGNGEQFAILRPGWTDFIPTELDLVGTEQEYAVTIGAQSPDDAKAVSLVVQANSSLPAPVASLQATRTGEAADIDFDWVRRTRARHRALGATNGPLLEGIEEYDVVINTITNATLNRVINVDEPLATYTVAQQTVDGSIDQELVVEVYQLDQVRGRGRVATLSVPAFAATLNDENGADTFRTEDDIVNLLITEN